MDLTRCSILVVDSTLSGQPNSTLTYRQREHPDSACDTEQPADELTEMLLESFAEVIFISSGNRALDYLDRRPRVGVLPTILLIDLDYTSAEPDNLSSINFLRRITREIESGKLHNVVPVACSKDDTQKLMLQCLREGAADYLIKPLRRETIRTLFLNLFRYQPIRNKPTFSSRAIGSVPTSSQRVRPWNHLQDRWRDIFVNDQWLCDILLEYFNPSLASVEQYNFLCLDAAADEERVNYLKSRVCSWDFWPQEMTEEDLLRCVYLMLEQAVTLVDDPDFVNKELLQRFIFAIRNTYHHTNPYHNFVHAVDVLQSTYYFLLQMGLLPPLGEGSPTLPTRPRFRRRSISNFKDGFRVQQLFRPIDILALLVATIGHDVGHPGVNNLFLINLECPLAMLYNDRSVLENFHSMALFQLLKKHGFCGLDCDSTDAKYMGFRKIITSSVLATDMALHWDYISKLKDQINRFKAEGEPADMEQERLLICGALIKCADISNCARPFHVAQWWSKRLLEEFTSQGDLEREIELPVLPMFDREKVTLADSQIGFISGIALPLYEVVQDLIPELEYCVDYMQANKKIWEVRKIGVAESSKKPLTVSLNDTLKRVPLPEKLEKPIERLSSPVNLHNLPTSSSDTQFPRHTKPNSSESANDGGGNTLLHNSDPRSRLNGWAKSAMQQSSTSLTNHSSPPSSSNQGGLLGVSLKGYHQRTRQKMEGEVGLERMFRSHVTLHEIRKK
ncbi:uncharacterized protein VTP21DRAFT_5460 [Calcarisporiella thermophila]|uniref:uncharacterized protein n=1 Tax=Calcarisporiella thermophila TaxID=911321 RepID=UPI003742C163